MPESPTADLHELNVGDEVTSKDKTRTGEEAFRGGLVDIIVCSDPADPTKVGSKFAVIAKDGKLVISGLMKKGFRVKKRWLRKRSWSS